VYDIRDKHSDKELALNDGDEIIVTCGFENTTDAPVVYGEGSRNEMCFVNVLAWPAGSISNGLLISSALGLSVEQSCLDP